MLVHACEQLDRACVCVHTRVCVREEESLSLYPVFPSWEAGALGGGWGGAALMGREDQRRQEVRTEGEGADHRQFPEGPRL